MNVSLRSITVLTWVCMMLATAADAQRVGPMPIPIFAWSTAEMGKERDAALPPWRNITGFFWLTDGGLDKIAEAKAALDKLPEGRRVIFDWDVYRIAYQHPDDQLATEKGERFAGPWWDHGLAAAEDKYDRFLRAYKDLGGQLDFYIIDTEHGPASDVNNAERWAAVANDPRGPELLAAMHLTSPDQVTDAKPFSFAWWRYSDYLACQRYNRLFQVVRRYFPHVRGSDYGMGYHQPAQLVAWGETPDVGETPGRTGCHVGTHQAPSLYGVVTYLSGITVEGKPFGLGPFRSALYATNVLREAMLANPEVPLMPWVAWRGYVSDWEKEPADKRPPYSSIGNTDYFQEVFFHAVLCNPRAILTWNPYRWREDQEGADYCQDKDMALLDDMADQANELVGWTDRDCLVSAMTPVHQPFILTGCLANNGSVWRLTPDPDQSPVELEKIRVSDDPLTFRLGETTLTMPGGRIVMPAKQLSTVGYWITGPDDLRPVVTQD
jgi:hypothetical protein